MLADSRSEVLICLESLGHDPKPIDLILIKMKLPERGVEVCTRVDAIHGDELG